MEFTHFDPGGKAWMVDVGGKEDSRREAVAEGTIRMRAASEREMCWERPGLPGSWERRRPRNSSRCAIC